VIGLTYMKVTKISKNLTDKRSFLFCPQMHLIHQPQKLQLVSGKNGFEHTTVMCITGLCETTTSIAEEYKRLRPRLLSAGLLEFQHIQTGTHFMCCPYMFHIFQSKNGSQMVSIYNPAFWVPIQETCDEIQQKLIHDYCDRRTVFTPTEKQR
jgi:hypothetical protein